MWEHTIDTVPLLYHRVSILHRASSAQHQQQRASRVANLPSLLVAQLLPRHSSDRHGRKFPANQVRSPVALTPRKLREVFLLAPHTPTIVKHGFCQGNSSLSVLHHEQVLAFLTSRWTATVGTDVFPWWALLLASSRLQPDVVVS